MSSFLAEGNFPTLMSVWNFWTVKRGFTVLIRVYSVGLVKNEI